jgi:hypothetical protein
MMPNDPKLKVRSDRIFAVNLCFNVEGIFQPFRPVKETVVRIFGMTASEIKIAAIYSIFGLDLTKRI